jgi:hypothetical protein
MSMMESMQIGRARLMIMDTPIESVSFKIEASRWEFAGVMMAQFSIRHITSAKKEVFFF